MRIGFMGTPDFAVPALKKLIESFDVAVIYTKEPKPVGRGQHIQKTPVHLVAEENGIEVRISKSLKNNAEEWEYLKSLDLDYMIVCAYGLILPDEVIEANKMGCINIHGSLLPRWRGAAPIQRAIMKGDKETGITIMQVIQKLDAGDMLLKGSLDIDPGTTASSLHDDMAGLGAKLIVAYINNPTQPEKQDEALVTYAEKVKKEEGLINWEDSADKILRQYNALSIWPGIYFEYEGEIIKVKAMELVEKVGNTGELLDKNMTVACGYGAVRFLKLQRPGKTPTTGEEFFNGEHDLNVGDVL